ncbi:hypothetical protein FAI40_06290 [Acetobacteraceae bacterium]|nr:hypothetical protein FAI40_06145 [Acetobacteraceae bacterium]QCE34982.1 hypothetical protein FAI40_06290 [Acetobacteraceae bacterium]
MSEQNVNVHDSIEKAVSSAMGREPSEDILLEELDDMQDFGLDDFGEKSSCCFAKHKCKIVLALVVLAVLFLIKRSRGCCKK